jgi:hypothetical protein
MTSCISSALEVVHDHAFNVILPSIGGVDSDADDSSISQFTTLQRQPIALSPSFKWQVGLVELAYVNTIYTITDKKNVITLLSRVRNTTVRTPVRIPADEYLSPAAFVKKFNDTVAATITLANTNTAGTFKTNAALTLTFGDDRKCTLTPTALGFEILKANGGDLLKALGQISSLALSDAMSDVYVPVQDYYTGWIDTTTAAVEVSWANILTGLTTADCILDIKVVGTGGKTVSIPCNMRMSPTELAAIKRCDDVTNFFTAKALYAIDSANTQNPRQGFDGENVLRFSLDANNLLQINSINTGLDITPAKARWFIQNMGICTVGNRANPNYVWTLVPEKTDIQRVWISTYGSPNMCLYRRLDIRKNKFYVIVGDDAHELEVPTGGLAGNAVEYSNVVSIISAMRTAIAGDADLQADLSANSATVTLTYNPTAEVTKLTYTILNCYFRMATEDSTDLARLLGSTVADLTDKANGILWQPKFQFGFVSMLASMPRDLYVYLPDIISNSLVAGAESALVRCIQMMGPLGSVQTFKAGESSVLWYDVAPTGMRMDRIRVEIRNTFGEMAKFQWGHLVVTLQFRPILPFAPF